MNDITPERIEACLREMSEVSRKHGLVIEACGCCQGPYLRNAPNPGEYRSNEGECIWWDESEAVK